MEQLTTVRRNLNAMLATAFHGSDGVATRKLLRALESTGDRGRVAAELFRLQKTAEYIRQRRHLRGKRLSANYTEISLLQKGEALRRLCDVLEATNHGLAWGWRLGDPNESYAPHTLHVDLPTGHACFHSRERFNGPDYTGAWDDSHARTQRILCFCRVVLNPDEDDN